MNTDRDWEKWGATDPYFGVLSESKYRTDNMDSKAKADFFKSGEIHITNVIDTIREHFDSKFSPKSALDFGSGVGRLIIPMARRMTTVMGVDISTSMIAEACKNCADADIHNAQFVLSDDDLKNVDHRYDLVHSFIVLQHIPWRRGRKILQSLSSRVAPGGYLAVQFIIECHEPKIIRGLVHLRYWLPPLNWIRNLLLGRPIFEPAMQLHVYDFSVVLDDLKKNGFDNPYYIMNNLAHTKFKSVFLFIRNFSPA